MWLKKVLRKWLRMPSQEESRELESRKYFYSALINKGDLVFDVGANLGNRVKPMLQIGSRVVAVEPQPMCIEVLKKKFGNKIEIVPMGLGAQEGELDFYISDVSTISSFSKDWIESVKESRFKSNEWNEAVKMKITTLDLLIKKYGNPDFIKIDVEGFELEVLNGLNVPVKLISYEYTVPEQINKAIDCLKTIEKIDRNIECNYSIGEGMAFALPQWIPSEKMIEHIQTNEFVETEFGDIYVRNKSLL